MHSSSFRCLLLLFMQMSTSATHLYRSHFLVPLVIVILIHTTATATVSTTTTTTRTTTNSHPDHSHHHHQQQQQHHHQSDVNSPHQRPQQQQRIGNSGADELPTQQSTTDHHHHQISGQDSHINKQFRDRDKTTTTTNNKDDGKNRLAANNPEINGGLWDDPFGGGLNPVLYMQSNRTPAYEDVRIIIIYVAFLTAFVAFLIIFPGIRQDRFSTLTAVSISLFVGVIILTSVLGTDWQRAHATISSPYRAFSKERITADLSVKIGLKSVNITLRAHHLLHTNLAGGGSKSSSSSTEKSAAAAADKPLFSCLFASPSNQHRCQMQQQQQQQSKNFSSTSKTTTNFSSTSDSQSINVIQHQQDAYLFSDDINFNERFYWIEATEMRQEFHRALERGLPYPILTVAEYLSQDEGGFSWSRQYRQAGYYADQLLWMAFATWIVMNVLLCAAPRYGVYTMVIVGLIMLGTNLLYWLLVPNNKHQLVIPFEGRNLTFEFGWSYWMVMIAGTISILVGTGFLLCFRLFPNYVFTTILDIDYDNHSQRHRGRNYITLSSASSSPATTSPLSSSAPSPSNSHYNQRSNSHRHHHHQHHHHLNHDRVDKMNDFVGRSFVG